MKKLFKLWLVAILGVFGLTGLTFALIGGPRAAAREAVSEPATIEVGTKADFDTVVKIQNLSSENAHYYVGSEFVLEAASFSKIATTNPCYAFVIKNIPDSVGSIDSMTCKYGMTCNDSVFDLDAIWDASGVDWKNAIFTDTVSRFIFSLASVPSIMSEEWGNLEEDTVMACKITFNFVNKKDDTVCSYTFPITFNFRTPAFEMDTMVGKPMEGAQVECGEWVAQYFAEEANGELYPEGVLGIKVGGGVTIYDVEENPYAFAELMVILNQDTLPVNAISLYNDTIAVVDLSGLDKNGVVWKDDSTYTIKFILHDRNNMGDTLKDKDGNEMVLTHEFKVTQRRYPKVSVQGFPTAYGNDTLILASLKSKPTVNFTLTGGNAVRGTHYEVLIAWESDTIKEDDDVLFKKVASGDSYTFDSMADGKYEVLVCLVQYSSMLDSEKLEDYDNFDDLKEDYIIMASDTTYFQFTMWIGERIVPPVVVDTTIVVKYGEISAKDLKTVDTKTPVFDIFLGQNFDMTGHEILVAYAINPDMSGEDIAWADTIVATRRTDVDGGVFYEANFVDMRKGLELKHNDKVEAMAFIAKDKKMIADPEDDRYLQATQFSFKVDTIKHISFNFVEGDEYYAPVYDESGGIYTVAVDSATPVFKFNLVNTDAIFGDTTFGCAVMYVKMSLPNGGDRSMNVYDSIFKVPAEWALDSGYTYNFTFQLWRMDTTQDGDTVSVIWDANEPLQTKYVAVSFKGNKKANLIVPKNATAEVDYYEGWGHAIKLEWEGPADQGYEFQFACNTCRGLGYYELKLSPETAFIDEESGKPTYYLGLFDLEGELVMPAGDYFVSMRGVNWVGEIGDEGDNRQVGPGEYDTTVTVLVNMIDDTTSKPITVIGADQYPSILITTIPVSNWEGDPEALPEDRTFTAQVANIELGKENDALVKIEWGLANNGLGHVVKYDSTNPVSFTIPADSVLKEGEVYMIAFTLVSAYDTDEPIVGADGRGVEEVAYFYTGTKPANLLNPKVYYVGATSFRTGKPTFEFAVRDTVLSDSVQLVVMRGQDTSSVFGVNGFVWKRDTVKTERYTVAEDMADGDYMLWAYLIAGKKAPYTVISDTMKVEGGISIATNTILTVAVAGSDRTFGPDSTATFNHAKPSFKLTLDGAKFGANEAWVQVKYGMNEDDMETVLVKTPAPINYDGCTTAEDSTAAEEDYALYGAYNAIFTVAEPLEDGHYTIEFRVMKGGKVDETAQHVYPCYFDIATVRPQVTVVPFNGDIAIGGGDEVEYSYPDSVDISGEFEFDYSALTLLVQVQGVQTGEIEGAPEFHAIGPNEDEDGNVIPGEPDLDGGFFPDLGYGGFGDDQFFVDGEGRPFEVSVHATLTKGTDTLEVELTPAGFGDGLFQLTADELYTAVERGWNEGMPGVGTWKVAYTVNYDSLPCLVKNLKLYGKVERDTMKSIFVQGFAKGEQEVYMARGFEDTVKMNIVAMNVDGVIGTDYAIELKVMNPQNWQNPEVIDTIIKTNVINPFKFVVADGFYTFSVTLLEPATGNQWEIMKDQDDQDIVFNSCFRMGLHCPDIENGEAGVLVDGYDATFVWAGVEGQYYEIIVAGDTAIVRADERIMNEEGMYTTGTATMEVGTYNFKIRGVKLAASFDNIMYIEIDSALMIVKATDWAEGEFAVETIVPYDKPEGARVSETYAQTTIAPSMMFEGVIDTTYNYGALFRWDESESNVEIEIYDTLGNLKDRLFSWGPEAREYLWNTKNPADSGKWFMWRIRTVDAEGEYDEEAEKTIYTVKEYNASEWDTVGRFQLVNWRNPNELVLNSAALMVYFGEEGIDYCEDCDLQTVRGGKRPTFSYIVSDVENELGEGSGIYFSIEDEDGDGEAIEEKTIRPIQTEGTITVGKDLVKNYGYIVNVWLVNANGDYYRGYYTGAMFTYVVEDEAFVEMPELKGVNVYPNPAAGQFNVTVPANGNVTIFNANGQVIARENNVEGVRSYNLRNSGIYFVRVIANGQAAVKRVVIR